MASKDLMLEKVGPNAIDEIDIKNSKQIKDELVNISKTSIKDHYRLSNKDKI